MAEAKAWECPYQEKGSGEYAQRCGGSMGHLCHRCRNDEANRRQKELLHTVRTYLRGYMDEMNERADARCLATLVGLMSDKGLLVNVNTTSEWLKDAQQAIGEGGGDE